MPSVTREEEHQLALHPRTLTRTRPQMLPLRQEGQLHCVFPGCMTSASGWTTQDALLRHLRGKHCAKAAAAAVLDKAFALYTVGQ